LAVPKYLDKSTQPVDYLYFMKLKIYQVDAFTDRVFAGNPAAVCPLTEWIPEKTMQQIAAENNLAETAFIVQENGHFAIRWFTPTVEVDL
jgi:PhzF family phenazine biosynthesis protein